MNTGRGRRGGARTVDQAGQPAPGGNGAVPLDSIATGRRVRLVNVDAGHELRARLVAMGLVPGRQITVTRNTGGGPVVVTAGQTRLALGRGMVHRMLVSPVDNA